MKFFQILCLLILTACAQKKDVEVDELNISTAFIKQGHIPVDINWWQSFNNEQLTQFVSRGLKDNLSLKSQDLRLKSSKITADIAGASLYPDLKLAANGTSPFDDIGHVKSASFGVSSSWELDIWGSLSSAENKAYWEYQGQEALYRAKANLVAANVTSAWLGIVSEQEKKHVLARQYQRTKDALNTITRRFAMGKNSVTNIWQQQKLLKTIEVHQEKNQTDLFLHQQTLALWLGIPSTELAKVEFNSLPLLPKMPETGIPAQVLKFRPDIEQAFAKIQSANENLSIAIAAQYPRITLRANYSTSSNSFKDLFDDWQGNLIASLTMPLFDSGATQLVIEQRQFMLKALMFDYQQTWLKALASVNQVLLNEAQLLKVAKNLNSQLELAKRTEKLTMFKYLNGKTNYLELLKAQESILSIEQQCIEANKKLVLNRVLLYRELSHGDFSEAKQVNNENIGKPS